MGISKKQKCFVEIQESFDKLNFSNKAIKTEIKTLEPTIRDYKKFLHFFWGGLDFETSEFANIKDSIRYMKEYMTELEDKLKDFEEILIEEEE